MTRAGARTLLATLVLYVCSTASFTYGSDDLQDSWAARLAAQEAAVTSAHAIVRFEQPVTDPATVEQLRALLSSRGEESRLDAYIILPEDSRRNSYMMDWWRSGVMERANKTPLDRSAAELSAGYETAIAFDGVVLRKLTYGAGPPQGVISSASVSGWRATERDWPYGLIFEWAGTPYSEMIRTGTDFNETAVTVDGVPCTEVAFTYSPLLRFALRFDPQGRMVERLIYQRDKPDADFQPLTRVALANYELIPCGGGNAVWFPKTLSRFGIYGTLPDGTAVEATRELVHVQSIEFNVDIPPGTFTLVFPSDAHVVDRLTDMGLLAQGKGLESLVGPQMDGIVSAALAQPGVQHPDAGVHADSASSPAAAQPTPVAVVGDIPSSRGVLLVVCAAAAVLVIASWLLLRRTRRKPS